jgi:hypothetical protein
MRTKINCITDTYENQQKVDVWFTLQIAAVRNTFSSLRGFAIPLPPYRAFPPYFTFSPPGLTARRFFLAAPWAASG